MRHTQTERETRQTRPHDSEFRQGSAYSETSGRTGYSITGPTRRLVSPRGVGQPPVPGNAGILLHPASTAKWPDLGRVDSLVSKAFAWPVLSGQALLRRSVVYEQRGGREREKRGSGCGGGGGGRGELGGRG